MPDIADRKPKTMLQLNILFHSRMILVKMGDSVKKGDIITDGSADLDEMFAFAGKERTEQYIIKEISKLYELQGENVARKHIEVMVRQMFNRRKVRDQGDTSFLNR